jgi:Tfp pilus assembly pilus retraction ATPase PilT
MLYTLSQLVEIMLAEHAQGLHLCPGEKPVLEVARTLFCVSGPKLEPADTDTLLRQIATAEEYREFPASRILSCYHHVEGKALFNVLAFKEHEHVRLEIRAVR